MMDRTCAKSEPYDPYIPNNQRGANGGGGNQKTQHVQQQVDEVVNIMQENIDKVMQRGERIDDLRGKTEDLQSTAGHFRRGANQVRKRMWWKDLKWKIIIAVTIIVILGIIIGKNSTSTTSKKELTTVFFISSLRGIPHRLGSIVGTQTHNDNSNNNSQPAAQPTTTQ